MSVCMAVPVHKGTQAECGFLFSEVKLWLKQWINGFQLAPDGKFLYWWKKKGQKAVETRRYERKRRGEPRWLRHCGFPQCWQWSNASVNVTRSNATHIQNQVRGESADANSCGKQYKFFFLFFKSVLELLNPQVGVLNSSMSAVSTNLTDQMGLFPNLVDLFYLSTWKRARRKCLKGRAYS